MRKTPIKHIVHRHKQKGKIIEDYIRGRGYNPTNSSKLANPSLQKISKTFAEHEIPSIEMLYQGLGKWVLVKFKSTSKFGANQQELRNIAEIHSNYPSWGEPVKNPDGSIRAYTERPSNKVVFESDIHFTGLTYDISDIKSITIWNENVKADGF